MATENGPMRAARWLASLGFLLILGGMGALLLAARIPALEALPFNFGMVMFAVFFVGLAVTMFSGVFLLVGLRRLAESGGGSRDDAIRQWASTAGWSFFAGAAILLGGITVLLPAEVTSQVPLADRLVGAALVLGGCATAVVMYLRRRRARESTEQAPQP